MSIPFHAGLTSTAFLAACLLLVGPTATQAQDAKHTDQEAKHELKIEDLLTQQLEVTEGIEVIVSRVSIPPHTSLPMHWHPGEEFAYILEGSAILVQEGMEDIAAGTGEVLGVPLKQVHTARTEEEGATILVFRVHEMGEPGRTIVE